MAGSRDSSDVSPATLYRANLGNLAGSRTTPVRGAQGAVDSRGKGEIPG
jgi:hypothetical protein